ATVFGTVRSAFMRPTSKTFGRALGALVAVSSAAVAWHLFGGEPAIVDEMTQRFQARLLLGGRTWLPAEALPEFFLTSQTPVVDGRWFGEYPIGGPLLAMLGELVRAPWAVDPLLAGFSAWGVYRVLSRVGDDATARVATILFALSPFVLLMSASQM